MVDFFSNDYKDILTRILDYYYSKCKDDYIPALISEGSIIDSNADLYIKTILIPKDFTINNTWLLTNLSRFPDNNIYNIIVLYNYKFNNLYGLNPYLMSEEYVIIEEQKNNRIMSLVYNEPKSIIKPKILKNDLQDNNIFIYLPLLKELIGLNSLGAEFKLCIEIEYRVKNEQFTGEIGKYQISNGFADVFYENRNNEKEFFWLKATISLDGNRLNKQSTIEVDSSIKVVSLNNASIRDLNRNNYNDDLEAGLVVFDRECLTILKKYYYFYSLKIIPKRKNYKGCLIDILDDVVVFWEGEFNSLPEDIIKELIPFNIITKTSNLLTEAMFSWQLDADFNFSEKLLPNMKLALYIEEKHLEVALENELDFLVPESDSDYSNFVKKLFKVINFNIKLLRLSPEKEKLLTDIMGGKIKFESQEKRYVNYQGLCYSIIKVLKDDTK